MFGPEDLSIKELKGFHKDTRERLECAKNIAVKTEAIIVLSMIDKELDARGYDVEKLFKGYVKIGL